MNSYLRTKDHEAKTWATPCTDDTPPSPGSITGLRHGDLLCAKRPADDPSGRLYYVYAVVERGGEKTTLRINNSEIPAEVTALIANPVLFYRPSFLPMKIYMDNVAHKKIIGDRTDTIYYDCVNAQFCAE